MTKLATADLPKVPRKNAKSLPASVVDEAAEELVGSIDFRPHAYTDGKEYPTYSEALSAANLTIREAADAMGHPRDMFRRRVWDTAQKPGKQNRKKSGKWIFAVSQRSTPPKSRQAATTPAANDGASEPATD